MDSVPFEFTDSVCHILAVDDLRSLIALPCRRWGSSASTHLARIVTVDLAISKDKNTNDFYVFLSLYGLTAQPTTDNIRIHRLAIKGFDNRDTQFKRERLVDGLRGDSFLQILDIASIQCRSFALERVNANIIDLSRFNANNLENLTIMSCDSISSDSEVIKWIRNIAQFRKLKNMQICDTPSPFPVDISEEMSDLLVNCESLEKVESASPAGESFFHINEEFIRIAVQKWMNFDHQKNRSCVLYGHKGQLKQTKSQQGPSKAYMRGEHEFRVCIVRSADDDEVTFRAIVNV